MTHEARLRALALAAAVALAAPRAAAGPVPPSPSASRLQDGAELEAALAEEREQADRDRRTGAVRRALSLLGDHLDDDPGDARSRRLLALCLWDQGEVERAIEEARHALADAQDGTGPAGSAARAACARTLAALLLERGEGGPALAALADQEPDLDPARDPRDAWALGRALEVQGRRVEAREAFRDGASASVAQDSSAWEGLLARARCERRLGLLERASRSLVQADDVARRGRGVEADVLVELAEVYFEADAEVADPAAQARSPSLLYRDALEVNPAHEGALVGLYELGRFNWRRQRRAPHEYLQDLFAANPRSIAGNLAACAGELEDGRLPATRERLERLRELAPRRREVRTLEAALAWVEHDREGAEARLAELAREDPSDGVPEREVGRILFELYRFAEGVPFVRRSVERDPGDADAWTQLGRGLANTGDEAGGLEALRRAVELAGLRQNAWRNNMLLVLERLAETYRQESFGDLTFVWLPEAAEILGTYQVPFYEAAREEFSRRYGYTAGPTRIEIFRRHPDFSVRSTGFEGFPALGVCFGPVVTALSPLSEMRGNFSWARTAFHEFSHVVHLGLSHNRCPRWITEGLATWEETNREPAWDRNMRRDLLDARANGDVIPVRELNRAFRGPRITFGYYQGGLLCSMLIERHGFPPMIRLLEAFDRGLDLDEALETVFDTTPEELDRDFAAYVARIVDPLRVEPRWDPGRVARLRVRLRDEPPQEAAERAAWVDEWCTVAWGSFQVGRSVDAEQALRVLGPAADATPRALFLRGHMALRERDPERAAELWRRGFEAGGEDFFARLALGNLALTEGDLEAAERELLAAERAYPGFPDDDAAAELMLARIYDRMDRPDDAHRARERYLAWRDGEFPVRLRVARWHAAAGRHEEAARAFEMANEVDPFARDLHRDWGDALRAAGRLEEALREYRVAALVPPELELDGPEPLADEERAELLGLQAAVLFDLERREEAAERAREALALDPDEPNAREVLERTS